MSLEFKCAYCDKPIQTTTTPEGFFEARVIRGSLTLLEGCECQNKH